LQAELFLNSIKKTIFICQAIVILTFRPDPASVKKIFTFLLLAAFAAQCFNNVFIVFDFYANQKGIAATLCENRYRPMLHCDGKCQLAKKFNQEQNKNNQNPERKLENKNEFFLSKSFFITGCNFASVFSKNYFSHPGGKPIDNCSLVFHPPCA
jgi:phosphorylcholine metabolism protein LicD